MRTLVLLVCSLSGLPALAASSLMSLYDVNNIATVVPAEKEFSLTGELGLLAVTGNSKVASYSGRIDAQHEMSRWSNKYVAEFLYRERESESAGVKQMDVTAQRMFVSGQLDYKLEQPRNRLFVYSEFENDRFNGFDYQASLAAGWSSQAWKTERSELKYSVGPGYGFAQSDDSQAMSSNKGLILRASLEYNLGLSEDTKVTQYISTEAGQVSTKSRSETALSARIFGELAMKLAFIMNHNAGVRQAVESLDTETRVALVYNFF